MNFLTKLKALMAEEYGKTDEEIERLISLYPDVVMQGCLARNLDATAMALDIKDKEAQNHATTKTS